MATQSRLRRHHLMMGLSLLVGFFFWLRVLLVFLQEAGAPPVPVFSIVICWLLTFRAWLSVRVLSQACQNDAQNPGAPTGELPGIASRRLVVAARTLFVVSGLACAWLLIWPNIFPVSMAALITAIVIGACVPCGLWVIGKMFLDACRASGSEKRT